MRKSKEELDPYYEQKQIDHEEMADYLFWFVVICAAAACVGAGAEIVKFFMRM